MNKARRKEIDKLIEAIRESVVSIEALKDEEQEYLDNMPENLQESEKYSKSEEYVDTMENCIGEIDSALEELEQVTQ